MFLRFFIQSICFLFFAGFSCVGLSRNHVVTIVGGDVHLRGVLTEGACGVATDSEDMHVDMGQYKNNDFSGVGSESSLNVPFSVHLTGCNPALAARVSIGFYGMTDQKAPDAFLVTSGDGAPVGVSGGNGFSGLGLIISDVQGRLIMPDVAPTTTWQVNRGDVVIPFTAHYRATSRTVYPGPLRSDVWFRIVYP
ncbi:fimbrial protein [Serratia liquefaciens]|uniref:fimbrial protein n=1 Tax=Serratia liquefaciens TaxID=614 RepID=UPI0038227B05